MFDNIEAYIEPLIFFLVAVLALRTWAATEVKKQEIEEVHKNARSQINVDGKVASDRYAALTEMRLAMGEGGEDEDDMGQMMKLMGMLGGTDSSGAAPQEGALMSKLEEFAKTPDGADAMIKFNSFQSK